MSAWLGILTSCAVFVVSLTLAFVHGCSSGRSLAIVE